VITDPHSGKACDIYIIAISRQQPVTRTPAHEYVGLQAMMSLYLAQVRVRTGIAYWLQRIKPTCEKRYMRFDVNQRGCVLFQHTGLTTDGDNEIKKASYFARGGAVRSFVISIMALWSVCLSVHMHRPNWKTTCPTSNFSHAAAYGHGSVLLWRLFDTLYTYGFADDVMFFI